MVRVHERAADEWPPLGVGPVKPEDVCARRARSLHQPDEKRDRRRHAGHREDQLPPSLGSRGIGRGRGKKGKIRAQLGQLGHGRRGVERERMPPRRIPTEIEDLARRGGQGRDDTRRQGNELQPRRDHGHAERDERHGHREALLRAHPLDEQAHANERERLRRKNRRPRRLMHRADREGGAATRGRREQAPRQPPRAKTSARPH